jgi:di/tricarboxylate transporter
MDNLISGLVAAAIFIPFVVGLAVSIGAAPFAIIVAIVPDAARLGSLIYATSAPPSR